MRPPVRSSLSGQPPQAIRPAGNLSPGKSPLLRFRLGSSYKSQSLPIQRMEVPDAERFVRERIIDSFGGGHSSLGLRYDRRNRPSG